MHILAVISFASDAPHGACKFGGDMDSTGVAGGCWRVGVARVPVNKPGKTPIGESYAMAA